jgi:hypothetical protein
MHDSVWGAQAMSMVCELEGAERRLGLMRDLLRMGFALAHTRAIGSGGYTNGRVAAYGRYMTFENGDLSRSECQEAYAKMRLVGDPNDDNDNDTCPVAIAQSRNVKADEQCHGAGACRAPRTTWLDMYKLNSLTHWIER